MTNLHDARVEAAARELFHDPLSLGDYTWEEMVVEDKSRADLWRDDARRVLAAADAVVTVPPLHPDELEPVAINPLLRGVDLALDRLIRRDCFTERTLRVIDELREEIALIRGGEGSEVLRRV